MEEEEKVKNIDIQNKQKIEGMNWVYNLKTRQYFGGKYIPLLGPGGADRSHAPAPPRDHGAVRQVWARTQERIHEKGNKDMWKIKMIPNRMPFTYREKKKIL